MMRLARFRLITALSLAIALAACGSGDETTADDARQAEGEVLEGTVSDAMIPLDQLRSQGEPLRQTPPDGNAPAVGDAEGETDEQAGEAASSGTESEASETVTESTADEG